MDIRRHFWMVACTALFVWGGTATAQETDKGMPARAEQPYKPMPLSPEKSARNTTERMDSLLDLTKKQYGKLYKLNLKWAREDAENKTPAPRMGGRPEGGPGFRGPGQGPRGNRPPEGMAERRAPRDFAPSPDERENMEEQRRKLEKQREKREKKLKKILTDKQYARWVEERRPAMPEGRKDGKRHSPADHVNKDKRQAE
ncbi:DUF4890 domain-containing protein [Bacteroides sp. 14(A)]|uniref:DUF4890 domain-containing protein n=1 Tax=Bacteroides sp. 14(A) TaxID=1163670 RepID=UPI0012DCCCDC|nr:DUF4890 domain-containing protein [Bacteroides sp. 14(A)]